jgi:hypothetical protein
MAAWQVRGDQETFPRAFRSELRGLDEEYYIAGGPIGGSSTGMLHWNFDTHQWWNSWKAGELRHSWRWLGTEAEVAACWDEAVRTLEPARALWALEGE